MKRLLICVIFISSCSFYYDKSQIIIYGAGNGRLVISSENYYSEMEINQKKVVLDLHKGSEYIVLFYPYFYLFESRFPTGAVILCGDKSVQLNSRTGSLAEAALCLNRSGVQIDMDKLVLLRDYFYEKDDTWIYNLDDIKLFLQGTIPLSGILKKRKLLIPELEYLSYWEPENTLYSYWYPSVQSFWNPLKREMMRIEILENGTYNHFIYVN